MTPEQIKAKSDAKAKQIENLCKLLNVTLSAEEVLLPSGIIKKVIYYIDNEEYPHESPKENNVDATVPEAETEVAA